MSSTPSLREHLAQVMPAEGLDDLGRRVLAAHSDWQAIVQRPKLTTGLPYQRAHHEDSKLQRQDPTVNLQAQTYLHFVDMFQPEACARLENKRTKHRYFHGVGTTMGDHQQ